MSLKKRHENADVLFLSWLKLLSVSNDFPSALRNWPIKERTLVPKNRTQELCKHSINFCGKLVFIAINLHFFIFKTLWRKYCKRSNVFSFALFLSTDCASYCHSVISKTEYSNLRPALYVFFPWNCTMLISHKMDTKSENDNCNAINSPREKEGIAQIPQAGMILLTLTLLLTSQIVGLADRGNKNKVNSLWVMFWYYRTWARFRRRSFHKPNLIHWIKYKKGSASESIRDDNFNLERLARPGMTLDRSRCFGTALIQTPNKL